VLQADEILIDPKYLDELYKEIEVNSKQQFFNLITDLNNKSELTDKNIVKCVLRDNRTIINIFRKSGLVSSEETQLNIIKKICGVFAISKNCLSIVSGAQPQKIEISESIEQMKIIELGINILAVNTKLNYPSVNTPEEALLVERILDMDPRQKQILEMIN
jgi:3-deoxy-manno-octulosonate cytidylyltransferase (CMP-KDO synthetase)